LQGLSETHVISEERSERAVPKEGEPIDANSLVWSKIGDEIAWKRALWQR
jgi:hypothetical protein